MLSTGKSQEFGLKLRQIETSRRRVMARCGNGCAVGFKLKWCFGLMRRVPGGRASFRESAAAWFFLSGSSLALTLDFLLPASFIRLP